MPNRQFPRKEGILGILPAVQGAEWAAYTLMLLSVFVLVGFSILFTILESRLGLELRIGGANPRMASTHGISPRRQFIGLGLANSLIALSGALVAQRSYNADIHMGTGQIIVAVAALFIGMVIFRRASSQHLLLAALIGSVLYMVLMQAALEVGVQAQDFRLISTLIVLASIVVASLQKGGEGLRKGVDAFGIEIKQ